MAVRNMAEIKRIEDFGVRAYTREAAIRPNKHHRTEKRSHYFVVKISRSGRGYALRRDDRRAFESRHISPKHAEPEVFGLARIRKSAWGVIARVRNR